MIDLLRCVRNKSCDNGECGKRPCKKAESKRIFPHVEGIKALMGREIKAFS
jgi:hypothetical protein